MRYWQYHALIYLSLLDTFVKSVVIPHPSLCINESAILECHVTLNTAIGSDLSVLNISWYHNGTYLSNNSVSRNDQYLYISTLDLVSVSDTNSGGYTCNASIIENKTSVMDLINVTVQGQHSIAIIFSVFLIAIPRPMINAFPEDFLYPGVNVSITCESFDNSYNIRGPAGFSINQPIMINSLNFSAEGQYNCIGSNGCGNFVTLEMMRKLCLMQKSNDNVHFL